MRFYFFNLLFFLCLSSAAFAQDTVRTATFYSATADMPIHVAEAGGRYGIVNDTGMVILPFNFQEITAFPEGDTLCEAWRGVYLVKGRGMYGLTGEDGKPKSEMKYEKIVPLDTSCTASPDANALAVVYEKGKAGLVNTRKGQYVVRPGVDEITLFYEPNGEAIFPECIRVRKGKFFGFMHLRTKYMERAVFYEINPLAHLKERGKRRTTYTTLLAYRKKDVWGIIHLQNKKIMKAEYEKLSYFDDNTKLGLARAKKRYGFLSGDGNWEIKPKYDYAESFQQGIAIVRKGKKYGLLLPDGKFKVAPTYESLRFVGSPSSEDAILQRLIECKLKGKVGFISTDGKVILPPEYDKASYSAEKGAFAVEKDGKTDWVTP